MSTQNQFEKDAKASTNPEDDAAQPTTIKRELTDEEIAAVAGGKKCGPEIVIAKKID